MKRLQLLGVALTLGWVVASSGCVSSVNWPSRFGLNTMNQDALNTQLNLARLSERHGQKDQARKIYETVLNNDPDNQMAHHRLAVMAARESNLAEADQHFRRAVEVAPPTAELLNDMGYAFYLQDRLEEAENSFRQAIERDPQNLQAHNNLGLVLGEMGRSEESLAEFKIAGKEAQAYNNLGYACSQAGNVATAEQCFNRALTLDPTLRRSAEALLQLEEMKSIVKQAHESGTQVADAHLKPKDVLESIRTARRSAARALSHQRTAEPAADRQGRLAHVVEHPAREQAESYAAGRTTARRSAFSSSASEQSRYVAATSGANPKASQPEAKPAAPPAQNSLLAHALAEIRKSKAADQALPETSLAAADDRSTSAQTSFEPAEIVTPAAARRSQSWGRQATASLGDGTGTSDVQQVGHTERLIPSAFEKAQKADRIPVFRGPSSTRRANWEEEESEETPAEVPMRGPQARTSRRSLRGVDQLRASRAASASADANRAKTNSANGNNAENTAAPDAPDAGGKGPAPGNGAVAVFPWQQPTWIPNGNPLAQSAPISPANLTGAPTAGAAFGNSAFMPSGQ